LANVIAAVASLLSGRRNRAVAGAESLGAELAAVAAEGGTEPSELVGPDEAPDATTPNGAHDAGESQATSQSAVATEKNGP
jgi:hypothetical protein